MQPRRRAIRPCNLFVLVPLLLLAAAAPCFAGEAADAEAWCPRMAIESGTTGGGHAAPPRELQPARATYRVDLLGSMAVGSLAVEFSNPGEQDLRASYVTRRPIVPGSIEVQRGDRSATLQPRRGRAKQATRPARHGGKSSDASLFESGSVVLPAGESVTVSTRFSLSLPFAGDRFRLELPAVSGGCSRGGAIPTSVEIRVVHDQPLPLAESATHEILVAFEGDHTLVELIAPDPLGSRPFELGYALGESDRPALSSFVTPLSEEGTRDVMVVLAPPVDAPEGAVRPKEVLFVLDTSGSMKGAKIQAAGRALMACLEKLSPEESFNIIEFDSALTMLHAEPVDASSARVDDAYGWLGQQLAQGGTSLRPALARAFDQPHDADRHRLVVVLTDGQLSDEEGVLQFLQQRLGEARLFIVGIGEKAKQETILRLAEFGRGTAAFARDAETLQAVVTELFAGVSAPVAWDLRLDWGDAEVVTMEPSRLPDLYSGRPVTLFARVRGELPPDLNLEVSTMEGTRTFTTRLPAGGAPEHPGLQIPRRAATDSATKKPRRGGR